MDIPRSFESLLSACSPQQLSRIAHSWQTEPRELPRAVAEEALLYRVLDGIDKDQRWTLFELLDLGGQAEASRFPETTHVNEDEAYDPTPLRNAGLLFVINIGPDLTTFFVIPEELKGRIHRYREQLLLLMIENQRKQLLAMSKPSPPIQLPPQIQPSLALSQLLASSDPEGFRYPLSRALAIPETFPVSVKRTLKHLLHDLYLLFLPPLSLLKADRVYPLEGLISYITGVATLLSSHYMPSLQPQLLQEGKRPFSTPSELIVGVRRGLWRSFVVLLLDQFLTPIGATKRDENKVWFTPTAFHPLDIEVKRSDWLIECLESLGIKA